MARVRKPKPRAMPMYPTSGRIHMMLKFPCYETFMLEKREGGYGVTRGSWQGLRGLSCCVF